LIDASRRIEEVAGDTLEAIIDLISQESKSGPLN
jgi:hypothetical protein